MRTPSGCDLMLFDNVFQSSAANTATGTCCDLMLFDNVFQWYERRSEDVVVVI